jgi:hypothetical protein
MDLPTHVFLAKGLLLSALFDTLTKSQWKLIDFSADVEIGQVFLLNT